MLEDRNVLCISNPLWEGNYAKTIVELMSVFAKKNKVLYVDNAYTIKDLFISIFKRKDLPYKRILGLTNRVRKINIDANSYVYVLTPPLMLTINFLPPGKIYDLLLRFNGRLMTKSIRKSLLKLEMGSRLINIVAFNPSMGLMCGRKFNEALLIYHCYDQIEAADWLQRHGAVHEKKFMEMADAVIVTSLGLYESKKQFNKQCFIVKNAANIDLFSKAFKNNTNYTNTTVGYIGSIDNRLDYELLEYLISNMQDTNFVFVGRVVSIKEVGMLSKYKNVTFHGAREVQDLPGFLENFSVGIIPFVKNQFTKGIYPLKINEYLATGLPVVTTNFSHLEDFENIISVANSKEEFRSKIVYELAHDNEKKRFTRFEAAKLNSWEERVEEISEIIKKLEAYLN